MEESGELRAMRSMAWERAKGELRSMMHTFYGNANFIVFDTEVEKFITFIEDQSLQE